MARIVILGTGGHARAWRHMLGTADLLTSNDADVLPDDVVHVGVGAINIRKRLYRKFKTQIPERGIQWMGHTWEGPDCTLGDNLLLNTGVKIDHDCNIGSHCVISPGVILCGGVTLGAETFIGAGTIIVQGVRLGPKTSIPAGALVAGPDDIRLPSRVVQNNGTVSPEARAPGLRQRWDGHAWS